jgi:eukaryotic-like serine/threonine-protein kinase
MVTVSGTGFGAGEGVDVFFDTIDAALAGSDGTGNLGPISVTVPASATPGTHWISAQGRQSGLFAQTAFTVVTEWPQFGNGPEHHAHNGTENELFPWNISGMDLNWSFATFNFPAGLSSPAVASLGSAAASQGVGQLGGVYVGCEDWNVYALDAATGGFLWNFTTQGQVLSSPAVADGVVYVGSMDGNLYALSAASGTELWSFPTGGPIESSPAVADAVVYVANESNVYALDTGSLGAVLWSFPASLNLGGVPAVANVPPGGSKMPVTYVGSNDGTVYALWDGAELWSTPVGGNISCSPAVAYGLVYIGTDDGNVCALNAVTGAEVWSFTTGPAVCSSPAVADGVVYLVAAYYVYALDAATGDELWNFFADEYSVWSSPAVANGVVYVGAGDNVYALDAATGDELSRYVTGGLVQSSPAVANGMVYVGSNDGNIYAFGLANNDT